MGRWKKDAVEFEVGVINLTSKNGPDSKTCIIPKPIFKMLGEPNSLKFLVKSKNIIVMAGEK